MRRALIAVSFFLFATIVSRAHAQPGEPVELAAPRPPAEDLLGESGESCRLRFDCAAGLSCVDGTCAHPMEGASCGARADCGSGLRCVRERCVSESRLRLSMFATTGTEPHGWGASSATAGMIGASLSGGGFVSWDNGGGALAFVARGGVLLKNKFPVLVELGPVFDFGWSFRTRGQLTALVGAYAGRRSIAWAPKIGIGGVFGDGGRDEYTFNFVSFGLRTRGLVIDFDVFSYRIRRIELRGDWSSDRGVEHRMISGIAFHKVVGRTARR
jgi:hypothetical protein